MYKTINDKVITLGTESGSILELSKMTVNAVQRYNDKFGLGIKNLDNCFFFNRLKAGRNTKGEGIKLMKELVKILNKNRVQSVIL